MPYSKRKFITIAAVMAMDPEVVILDEPTAGQDRESTELLGKLIRLLTEKKKTVITITHDMEFVTKEFPREIFWDEELLQRSALKQPYICQLAKALDYQDVMTMAELEKRITA